MGAKNGRIERTENVTSDDEFSDNEVEITTSKKPVFNPYFRILINDCISQSHGDLTARILHRCAQQRPDFREFLENLGADARPHLKDELQAYVAEVVAHLDDEDKVKRISREYGRAQVPLRSIGYKPDFFAVIADAIATECVFIGGQVTAASPTNTFKAWTMLVAIMFSSVRDGYYSELRKNRKHSPGLEHQRSTLESCKTSSIDSNCSSGSKSNDSPSTSRPRSSTSTGNDSPKNATTARRAYKGSRSAAVIIQNGCTRSCDAINEAKRDYREPIQHYSQDITSKSPSPLTGRFTKNISLDFDNRKKRFEDISRKHNAAYPSNHKHSTSSSSLFDPNRIIDAFMNDQPF